jgi:hypothetical protein
MNFKNYIGLLGAMLVIAGGMSPMLRIPVIGNWNYLDIDKVLASIVFVLAATGLLGAVMKRAGLVKFAGWGVFAVVLFTLVAVYFKVNDYFSFIPFKKLASLATNMVHYKWIGWLMLFSGAFLMIGSAAGNRKLR